MQAQLDKTQQLSFPEGILGFPDHTQFRLEQVDEAMYGWWWLTSSSDSSLKFLVCDPFVFFPEYDVELSASDLGRLNLQKPSDANVLSLVTANESFTANLAGPVVVNHKTHLAFQIVLDGDFPTAALVTGA